MIQWKRFFAMTLSAIAVSMVLSIPVFAEGNYTDTTYNFKVSNSNKYTNWRPKLDDTSASIRVTSGNPVIVRVYGNTGTLGTSKDCTVGTPKVVKKSNNYTYLPNLVKENGGTKARLGIQSSTGTSFTSKGKWSPDSI